MNLGLGGKSAFVTGGAQGLGAAIADTLRAEDVHVLIADIDAGALKTRAHDYPEAILADLATAEGVTQATNAVIAELGGPPDILINNVGIGFNRPFAETTDSDWMHVFSVNFFSHVRVCRRLVPLMAAAGSGAVLNVASDVAKQPEPTTSTYAATKAAMISLTKTLSLEYAALGVRVNAICPGPIWTPLWTKPGGVLDQLAALYGVGHEEATQKYVGERKIPLGIGEPADVATLAAFLVSPLAKHVTGSAFDVNGGSIRSLF